MTTPLDNLPTNYLRQYVMATDQSGCEIYMPVNSVESVEHNKKKAELQTFLDNQPPPSKQFA